MEFVKFVKYFCSNMENRLRRGILYFHERFETIRDADAWNDIRRLLKRHKMNIGCILITSRHEMIDLRKRINTSKSFRPPITSIMNSN